jgi:formamidopyrimidine-DNA glycosylase
MPEMPEVETIRRSLKDKVTGRQVENVDINLARLIKYPDVFEFKAMLLKRTITDLGRRGKYLLFHLDNNWVMVVHLRMTGQLYYQTKTAARENHTHIVIGFDNGDVLMYADSRAFGAFYLMPTGEIERISGLSLMGPEPLSKDFTLDYFKENLLNRKGKIKPLILNQSLIGGIGNIYADESLFIAGVDPERQGLSLSESEAALLYDAINKVIADGIEHGGTTFRDYRDGEGKKGSHQKYLYVYGRHNQPCPKCKTLIARKKVAGRSSHYCPNCQK